MPPRAPRPRGSKSWWDDFTNSDNWWFDSGQSIADVGLAGAQGIADRFDALAPDQYATKRLPGSSMYDPRYTGGVSAVSGMPATGTLQDVQYADTADETLLGKVMRPLDPFVNSVATSSKVLMAAETLTSRGASVVGQTGNRYNPLYNDGVSLDDFQKMWNASRNDEWEAAIYGSSPTEGQPGISPGQSAGWAMLSSKNVAEAVGGWRGAILGALGTAVGSTGLLGTVGTSLFMPDEVRQARTVGETQDNIYDPEQQKQMYDNTVFAIGTGVADTAFQIAAGGAIDRAVVGLKNAVGLNTEITTARQVVKATDDIADHLLYVASGGQQGRWTRYGYEIQKVADSTEAYDIATNPMFTNSPRSLEIADMLKNVSDPIMVAKVWAADHGDRVAIASIMRDDPSIPFRLFDGQAKLTWKQAMEDVPIVTRADAPMYRSIYDNALQRPGNEYYQTAYNIFLGKNPSSWAEAQRAGWTKEAWDALPVAERGTYNEASTLNSRYVPISGPLGRMSANAAERRARARIGEPIVDGDGWTAQVFGNVFDNTPTTVGIQWVGGRRPAGWVNQSGLVPDDAVTEALSSIQSMGFARGNRTFVFERDGQLVRMSGPDFQRDAVANLAAASRIGEQATQQALMRMETDLLSGMIHQTGVPFDQAKEIATSVVSGKQATINNLKEVGFFFDSAGNRVTMNAGTQRQLVDSYVMLPLGDIARELRQQALQVSGKNVRRGAFAARHAGDIAYETIQKYVRTEQLIRPSYLKNSVIEPIGARTAYEGVDNILSIAGQGAVGLGNYIVNRGKSLGVGVVRVGDTLRITGGKRLSVKVAKLHQDRLLLEGKLDNLEAALQVADSGVKSPATSRALRTAADTELNKAREQLRAIYDELDAVDPQWQVPGMAPDFSTLRGQVRLLDRAAADPNYVSRQRMQLDALTAREQAEWARTQESARRRLQADQARLAVVDERLVMADNPEAVTATAETLRAKHRALTDLQYFEQRLAWAQRMARGETPPAQQDAINNIEKVLQQLRDRRQRVAEKLQGDESAPSSAVKSPPRGGEFSDIEISSNGGVRQVATIELRVDGEYAGYIKWDIDKGTIANIEVPEAMRRRGYATALLNQARSAADERGIAQPKHSPALSDDAKQWISGMEQKSAQQEAMPDTATAPRSGLLDSLDQRIAEQERKLQDTKASAGTFVDEEQVQNILDTFPEKIERIRADLGDDAPDISKLQQALDESARQYDDALASMSRSKREYEALQMAEIRGLEDTLPKFTLDDNGQRVFTLSADDIAANRAEALRQVTEETETVLSLADNGAERLDFPELFGDIAMSGPQYNIYENDGLIPLTTALKALESRNAAGGARSEEFWLWLQHGVIDDVTDEMVSAAQTQAGAAELRQRAGTFQQLTGRTPAKGKRAPMLTTDDYSRVTEQALPYDEAQALLKGKRVTEGQAAVIRRIYPGIKVTTSRADRQPTLYVKVGWKVPLTKRGIDKRVAAATDDLNETARAAYASEYDDIAEALDDMRAELDDGLAEFDSNLASLRGQADQARGEQQALNGERRSYGLSDPIPGTFDRRLLESERTKLQNRIDASQQIVDTEFTPSKRITALESDLRLIEAATSDPALAPRIAELRAQMDEIAQQRMGMTDSAVPIESKIAAVQAQIQALAGESAQVSARRLASVRRMERLRKRRTQTDSTFTIKQGNDRLTVPGLFSESDFGSARRRDFSAGTTNSLTVDPSQTSAGSARLMAMSNGSETVLPTDPRYFAESAYVANRHIVGDPFWEQILEGATNGQIMQWFSTPAGREYVTRMGWLDTELQPNIVKQVTDQIKDGSTVPVWDEGRINASRRIAFQYYPTEEARRLVLAGDVQPGELQAALAGVDPAILSPVQGHALEAVATNPWQRTRSLVGRALNGAWNILATKPEDAISRIPFASRLYQREMQLRLDMMAQQGQRLSAKQYNALKMSTMQYTLRESKRTFYNITRYSNPVYAARYFLVYPQAVFNTMWRAARLAYRKPGSAMVINNAWTSAFATIGVDENGDPTKEYDKIESIIIPVPEWMQTKGGFDDQAKLPVKAFQLLDDRVGATWTVQIPAQTILMNKPDAEPILRKALGSTYEMVFPFGTPSGLNDYTVGPVPVGGLIPNYYKSAEAMIASFLSDDGNERRLRVTNQILSWQAANGEKPNPDKAQETAFWHWTMMSIVQSGVPGGGGLQVVGQVERDTIRDILDKYGGDKEAALPEVLETLPHLSDPMQLVASSSEYRAYIPATTTAYEIVTSDRLRPLLEDIVVEGDGDPEMIGLLVADKKGFDANVYDSLDSLILPGDNAPVRSKPTAEVMGGRIEASKAWDTFSSSREALMAEVARRGLTSIPDGLQQQWNEWLDGFKEKNAGTGWLKQYEARDFSSAQRALNTLQRGLDSPAMERYRNTSYWMAVEKYLENLPTAIEARNNATSAKGRLSIDQQWDLWVNTNIGSMDSTFLGIYNRYLAEKDTQTYGR